jgi:hypothetical protein
MTDSAARDKSETVGEVVGWRWAAALRALHADIAYQLNQLLAAVRDALAKTPGEPR